MKVRTDFVTNSSSSSFVLGFKSEDTIRDELAKSMPERFIEVVYNDVKEAAKMNPEAIVDIISDDLYWQAEYDVMRKHRLPFSESLDWVKTDEGKAAVNAKLNKLLMEIKKRMEGFNVFAIVEYEDHTDCGSYLEHDILPEHPNNIIRISHH